MFKFQNNDNQTLKSKESKPDIRPTWCCCVYCNLNNFIPFWYFQYFSMFHPTNTFCVTFSIFFSKPYNVLSLTVAMTNMVIYGYGICCYVFYWNLLRCIHNKSDITLKILIHTSYIWGSSLDLYCLNLIDKFENQPGNHSIDSLKKCVHKNISDKLNK